MTKRHGIFGFIVISLTIMFSLAGCDNGTTPGSDKEFDEFFVDTYTHASQQYAIAALHPELGAINSKIILEPESTEYKAAVRFIQDYSHYLYVERNVGPVLEFFSHPLYVMEPNSPYNGINWKSAIVPASGKAKPYVAPAGDPLCRGVNVLSINPNGSITASHGSYWGCAPAGVDLSDIELTNAYGWTKSDKPQMFIYFSHGQTTQNLIDRKRGTLVIDAELSDLKPYNIERARYLFVEVKLRSYEQRRLSFKEYYDGLCPGGTAMSLNEIMRQKAGVTLLSHWEFWGQKHSWEEALPATALTSDAERAGYIASLEANPDVVEVMQGFGPDYLWFDILQITKVQEDLGWGFNKSAPYDPAGPQP